MFKVPNKFRIRSGRLGSDDSAGNSGAFQVESKIPGRLLFIIASDGSDWQESGLPGEPWEHVSVHAEVGGKNRMPTWDEMAQVKDLFWDGEDVVVQFHPRKSEYVNSHGFTLHLWRPIETVLPTPPPITVGVRLPTQQQHRPLSPKIAALLAIVYGVSR